MVALVLVDMMMRGGFLKTSTFIDLRYR